ncbi:MAG: hypothetical protein J5I47_08455 [Vicingus serpentipes]|nr:hypothetical protein [Vicingus serpentipes]
MKKLLVMLMVAGIFSLVACGPSEEEKAAAEAEATEMVEEMFEEEAPAAEEVAAEEAPMEEAVATEEEAPVEEATEEAH